MSANVPPVVRRRGSITELSAGQKVTDEQMDQIRILFRECDADGSGSIDKDGISAINLVVPKSSELKTILEKLGEDTSQEHVDEVFKSMDKDGGGTISFVEFIQGAPAMLLKAAPEKAARNRLERRKSRNFSDDKMLRVRKLFKECDADGSDSIEITEMQQLLKKLGHNLTDTEAQELFSKMDVDGGGNLSFFEFLNNAPDWLIGETAIPEEKPRTPREGRSNSLKSKKRLTSVQFQSILQTFEENTKNGVAPLKTILKTHTLNFLDAEAADKHFAATKRDDDKITLTEFGNWLELQYELDEAQKKKLKDKIIVLEYTWEALATAIAKGDSQRVNELLSQGVIDIRKTDKKRRTVLHLAVVKVFEAVLAKVEDASLLNAMDAEEQTALYTAVAAGKTKIARALLTKGADVDLGSRGWSPLHIACYNDFSRIIKLLIQKKAKINATCVALKKYSPLHILISSPPERLDVKSILLVLESGADIHSSEPQVGTPLHLAAYWGHLEVAKILVDKGAKLDVANSKGRTPLDISVRYERKEVSEYLAAKMGKDLDAILAEQIRNRSKSGETKYFTATP